MKATRNKDGSVAQEDAELVRRCGAGEEEAWAALIDKYKNLIFSIPIKYGFSRDDAAEIFQHVCVELFQHIKTLRNPAGLPKWLMQVTAHRCYHARQQSRRLVSSEEEPAVPARAAGTEHPLDALAEAEREQALRDAVAALTPRCRELVRQLFYEAEPRPYQEIAANLRIATGSIGFIRGRCLDKLKGQLEKGGFA